ncbi:MAG: hypothetical protein ACREBI_10175 [Nitrosotalea sp.]
MKNLGLSITTLFLLLAVPLVIHNVNAATPQLTFGLLGSGPGQLHLPRGIAVDNSGNIYVADNRNHRVEVFDPSGKFISEFDNGGIPEGVAVDGSGNIIVVDRSNMTVKKFSPGGALLSFFGSAGSEPGQLGNAARVAIDGSGDIYVTDANTVEKFNSNGSFVSYFFANDTKNCCMNAMGIASDGSNNIYVADMFYNRILKFNSTGSILLSFNSTLSRQQAMSPQDVAVDAVGDIYVADTGNGRIVKFNPTGFPVSSLDISGVPVGMAIDKSGKIYVTDLGNNRVDVFTASQFGNNTIPSTVPQRKEIPLNQNSTALDAAIKLATSSPKFQSLVQGYNYTFSSDFEESGPLSKGGIGLTDHGFAFELYSGPVKPGSAVKVVEVLEDPALTKVLNVTSYPAVYEGGPMISSTPAQNSTSVYAQNDVTLGVNTGKGHIVITGSVYKLFLYPVVLKIQSPNGTLIAVSQLKPASDGAFSLSISPSAPLWTAQGNYIVTISSDSQEIGKTTFYFNGTNLSSVSHGINTMGRLSPLEQLKTGTAAGDVKCNVGLQLIFKAEDGSPACVKEQTAYKLAERGWIQTTPDHPYSPYLNHN